MAISERINPDNLNIHQFQEVPEAKAELPFDPEKDLPPDFKQEALLDLNTATDEHTFCYMRSKFRTLWPDERLILEKFSNEQLLGHLIALITKYDGEPSETIMYSTLSYASILVGAFPNIKIDTLIKNKLTTIAKNLVVDYKKQKSYSALLNITSKMKRIDPAIKLDVTYKDMVALKEMIPAMSLLGKVYSMEHLKYVDPMYQSELTDTEWRVLHEQLSENGIELAASMKVVAAHSVKIAGPGVIDIQMYPPEDINTSTPPIPKTRKF